MNQIHLLLPASIAHEHLNEDMQTCSSCSNNHVARWRCRDCIPSYAQCRSCIRQHHLHNPLHHIECWTGTHFRHAALWEVGVYIVVPHHDCKVRKACTQLGAKVQHQSCLQAELDKKEQDLLKAGYSACMDPEQATNSCPPGADADVEMDFAEEQQTEQDFDRSLDAAYRKYGFKRNARPEQSDDEDEQPDIAAAFDRTEPDVRQPPTLMRIVHTNGFHRVRVLTCRCHGSDMEVQDLVACHLMPTSFDSI